MNESDGLNHIAKKPAGKAWYQAIIMRENAYLELFHISGHLTGQYREGAVYALACSD